MTPFLQDEDFTLYVGNVRDVLRELPDESVDCIVTSPPYWGLRDYGTEPQVWGGDSAHTHEWSEEVMVGGQAGNKATSDAIQWQGAHGAGAGAQFNPETPGYRRGGRFCSCGAWLGQLGLEPTPGLFVAHMVELFREARRVLARHGTFWLNLGDSYIGGGRGGKSGDQLGENTISRAHHDAGVRWGAPTGKVEGLKQKDLAMIPARVAIALQDDGWWLRSENVWNKPNPMTESCTDRTTRSHEVVYQFTKAANYWYDQEPTREEYVTDRVPGSRVNETKHYGAGNSGNTGLTDQLASVKERLRADSVPQVETLEGLPGESPRLPDGRRENHVEQGDNSVQHRDGDRWASTGKNMRSVWTITVKPYRGAHFATFPPELPYRCIASGCPEWVCRTCGKPRSRMFEKVKDEDALAGSSWDRTYDKPVEDVDHQRSVSEMYRDALTTRRKFIGWSDCGHDNYRRGVVLDPFMGSGTTAVVARELGRHVVGIELNEEYARDQIVRRTQQMSLLT